MKKLLLFYALLIITTAAFAQIPSAGLLRYYPFSGNAFDHSLNQHHGTVMGATLTENRFGEANSAYNFNGTSDYILLPNDDIIGLNTYSFSIWVKPNALTSNYSGMMYSLGSTSTNRDQMVTLNDQNRIAAGSFNTGNILPFQSKAMSGPIVPGSWRHVVVIRDTVSIRMYVDGILQPLHQDHPTYNQPADYGTSSRVTVGGRSHLPWDSFFNGAIDDLRHYNRVLDYNEVMQLFNESRTGNRIKGTVYRDLNGNGTLDAGEPGVPEAVVAVSPDSSYGASNLNGVYTAYTLDGSFTITMPNPPLYHTYSPALHTATFSGFGGVDSLNDFGLSPIPDMNDLRITLTSFAAPRPGFDSYYQLTYKNVGTTTLSGTVKFLPDSLFNFDSASVAITATLGDTLSWSFSNLAPGQQSNIVVALNMPATATLGDTIYNYAAVTPVAGDQTPLDNVDTLTEIIIGSYDPNDKAVSPAGDITPQQVAAAVPLTYTIRFQNTGTAEAINVFIQDTLSNNLQIPTFEILSASHPYTFTLKDKAVEFRFDNIMLPDSNSNEPASHGFIKYRIKPQTNLQLNDVIENTAYIFFDFNEPIVTNTTSTMVNLVSSIYPPITSSISVAVFPNPGSGEFTMRVNNVAQTVVTTQVINSLGQLVYSSSNFANQELLERKIYLNNLAGGIYFLRVSNGNQTSTGKLIIQK